MKWLNRTVLGIALASLFSDFSHELATSVLPTFLASFGAAAAWLGAIEGISDGLSSFTKMLSGIYTDKLPRRKPIAVAGYVITALGTACFGFATAAWHVLVFRTCAWFGRGIRTPVKKALLAAAVTKETYGRAFGFERMMDTIGAIAGPAAGIGLLVAFQHRYPPLFFVTIIPGLIAALLIAFVVQEKTRPKIKHISLGERLRALPKSYQRFVLAAGIFGAGDFAPSLLILLATQKLTPSLGAAKAATLAVAFYMARNVLYAVFAPIAGWLADRYPKRFVLATGYAFAALMAVLIIILPPTIWAFILIFVVAGIFAAMEETLEDSLCAELVTEEHHGMAFGVLATVNGIGDFLSSIVVGVLWTAFGTGAAFGYSALLFTAGALLVLRTRPK